MAKIILNDEEFSFQGYNRNTYFNEDSMNSNAYISTLRGPNLASRLQALAESTITSISIKKEDETVIYSLTNISAKINSIDESYNGDDAINTNLNIQFNQ